MNLILLIKKSCLHFASEDKWIGWKNNTIHFAQLFAHVRKLLLKGCTMYMNLEVKMLTDFISALTDEFVNAQ